MKNGGVAPAFLSKVDNQNRSLFRAKVLFLISLFVFLYQERKQKRWENISVVQWNISIFSPVILDQLFLGKLEFPLLRFSPAIRMTREHVTIRRERKRVKDGENAMTFSFCAYAIVTEQECRN